MPTPLAHAVGAATAGWLVGPRPAAGRPVSATLRTGGWMALLGMFPDVDLLVAGFHRGPTHSLGAALVVALATTALTGYARLGAAASAAYASHALLDWLAADNSMPIGIMALWPITWEYYQVATPIFDSIWRRNETPDFWSHNIRALVKELAILVPAAAVGFWWATRGTRQGTRDGA